MIIEQAKLQIRIDEPVHGTKSPARTNDPSFSLTQEQIEFAAMIGEILARQWMTNGHVDVVFEE